MFKFKKSEENQNPIYENQTSFGDENYLKNNYFSKTFEENDSLKKEILKLRKQEVSLKQIIVDIENQLEFYKNNSPVHPKNEITYDKKEILENFNVLADKANNEIEKDIKIADYENQIKNYKFKIKELLKELRMSQAKFKELQKKRVNDNEDEKNNENKKANDNLNKKNFILKQKLSDIKKAIRNFKDEFFSIKADINHELKSFSLPGIFDSLFSLIQDNVNDINKLKSEYLKENQEKKQLFNMVQEMRGNIRVFCRIRPLLKDEKESCILAQNDQIRVENKLEDKVKFFEYDRVFPHNITQAQFFDEIKPLIVSVLDGYNVCIFAYGQTGSGKTFTMEGPPNDKGMNSRAINELFRVIKERNQTYSYTLQISLLEIYNDSINDLFSINQSKKLEIKQGASGNYIPDLTMLSVTSSTEVETFLEMGIKNRATASTNMNEHSSRSHLIYTIYISGTNFIENITFSSKLHLIDLAGSERLSKTVTNAETQKEAIFINKSLSALGDVIAARKNKSSHIPFRNSTLTYFLQGSLSGDSKTLMILQVSPSSASIEETQCSLTFASRVRCIELGPAKKGLLKKKEINK